MRKIASSIICLVMVLGVFGGLSVSAAEEPYVTHNFPTTMKVGDKLPVDTYYKIHNLIPNTDYIDYSYFANDDATWESFYYPYSIGGGGYLTTDNEGTLTSLVRDFCPDLMEYVPLAFACGYGTFNVNVGYALDGDGEPDWEEINDVTAITVEKPIISSNAPATIKIGSSLNLNTSLTNTALTNRKVADHLNASSSDEDDFYYNLFYIPSVEIIEGKDIVKQSNQDYSNTLNTSETLIFNKAGTVKLKVIYHTSFRTKYFGEEIINTLNENCPEDYNYNPEMILTINVTSDTVQQIASSDPTTGIKLEAESGVIPPGTTLKAAKVTEGGNYTIVNNALQQTSDKWVALDISLISEGVEIQPNGKVKITIPKSVWQGLNMNNMVLYHIAGDGTKTQIPFTLDSTKDNIIFETDHFSLYTLAEVEPSPDTGDTSSLALIIALVMLSATGLLFAAKKRRTAK